MPSVVIVHEIGVASWSRGSASRDREKRMDLKRTHLGSKIAEVN